MDDVNKDADNSDISFNKNVFLENNVQGNNQNNKNPSLIHQSIPPENQSENRNNEVRSKKASKRSEYNENQNRSESDTAFQDVNSQKNKIVNNFFPQNLNSSKKFDVNYCERNNNIYEKENILFKLIIY